MVLRERSFIHVLCCFFLLLLSNNSSAKDVSFHITKGVSIGTWLTDNNAKIDDACKIFDVGDVDSLAKYGFDHIRIPVSESILFHNDGLLNRSVWALVHKIIRRCRANSIRVVFDLHKVNNYYIDNWDGVTKESQNLIRIWTTILNELEKYPEEILAYELLNKANSKDHQRWNAVSNLLIKYIRSRNKKRIIVIGSNGNNKVDNIKYLETPLNDSNIIICFHFYEPSLLTKYKAVYTQFGKIRFKEALNYPGNLVTNSNYDRLTDKEKKIVAPYRRAYDRNYIKARFSSAVKYAKNHNVKLYLSEFGCLPNNGGKTRLAWLTDVISVCKEYKIPFCLWDYNSGFGFVDRKTGKIDREMLRVVVN